MRKKVLCLAVLLWTGSGLAMAAANPYGDATEAWSYEAMARLISEEIITGYDASAFSADKTATRYEMARFLANGLSKYDKSSEEQKVLLEQLAVEYQNELSILGIDYKAAGMYTVKEAPVVSSDAKDKKWYEKVKIDNESLVEYGRVSSEHSGDKHRGSSDYNWRQRLHVNWQINDWLSYHNRLEGGSYQFGADNKDSYFKISRNFLRAKNVGGIDTIQIGRQALAPSRYLAIAHTGYFDGIWLRDSIGKGNITAFLGDAAASKNDGDKAVELRGIDFNYVASQEFEANAMWVSAEGNANVGSGTESANYWDVGASIQLQPGLNLVGEYIRSDAEGHPNGWGAQLSYNWKSKKRQKGFYTYEGIINNKVPHDQAVSISYHDMEMGSFPTGSHNFYRFGEVLDKNGSKGWQLGYQNMLTAGVRFSLHFQRIEDDYGKSDKKYYTGLDFYY